MPPWYVVFQQMQRWLKWSCFEMLVEDTRSLMRVWAVRKGQRTAICIDSRMLQSTPESGARADYDGAMRRKARDQSTCSERSGGCLATLKEVMGHTSITTTLRPVHPKPGTVTWLEQFFGLLNW